MIKAAEHAEMIMKEVLKARKAMLESKAKFDEDRKKASKTKRSAAYEEMRKTVVSIQEDVEVSLAFFLFSQNPNNFCRILNITIYSTLRYRYL